MVSSRGESKGFFSKFVERKTGLYTAFKTATVDRGKELFCHHSVQN